MSKRKTNPSTREELVPLPPLRRRRTAQQPPRANIQDVVNWQARQPPMPRPSATVDFLRDVKHLHRDNPEVFARMTAQEPEYAAFEREQEKIAKALAIVHGTLAKEMTPRITNVLDMTSQPHVTRSIYSPKYTLNPLVSTNKAARKHAYEMNTPQLLESHLAVYNLTPIPSAQPRLVPPGSNTRTVMRNYYRTLLGTDVRDERLLTLEFEPGFVTSDGDYEGGSPRKTQDKRMMTRERYDKHANQFITETLHEDHVRRARSVAVSAVDHDEDNPRHVLRKRMSENLPQGQQP